MRLVKEKELFKEIAFEKAEYRILNKKNDSVGDVAVNLINAMFSIDVNSELRINVNEGRDFNCSNLALKGLKEWNERGSCCLRESIDSKVSCDIAINAVVDGIETNVKFFTSNPEKLYISGYCSDISQIEKKLNKKIQ